MTTIAPSGWLKTTVYLRKDQVRALKLAALDRGGTMSELLRRAIDRYLDLADPHTEQILRDRFSVEDPARDDEVDAEHPQTGKAWRRSQRTEKVR